MKVKEESEKVGLKLNIQKTKIMASGSITLWQIDGKQWKQWETLFWGAPKSLQMIHHCSQDEIKRRLFLGRKAMINLDSILKSRDITLPPKVHLVKVIVFSVVVYECENWTAKKAECWEIDAFELWCWRRLLRVSWTGRSNQSILKEISPEYSLEGPCWSWNSNTLATRCEKLTQWKSPWYWDRLKAGGEGDDRGWDGWMASPLNRHEVEQALRVGAGPGSLACCSPWRCKELDMTERLNWTEV